MTGVSRVNTRRRRPFIKVDNNENFDYSPVDYNGDNNDYGDYGYDYNDADGLVSFNIFFPYLTKVSFFVSALWSSKTMGLCSLTLVVMFDSWMGLFITELD